MLAVTPVHSATVLVALAGMGGTPVNNSAGKPMKLPPPATAFSAPPRMAARKRKMARSKVKDKGLSQKVCFHRLRPLQRRDGIRAKYLQENSATS